MKKKIVSIVAIILLVFFIVFTFAPCIFKRQLWTVTDIFGSAIQDSNRSRDYYEISAWYSNFFEFLPILLSSIGIVALLLQCFDKNFFTFKVSKKQISLVDIISLSPIFSFVSFAIVTTVLISNRHGDDFSRYYFTYSPLFGYKLEFAVLIIASLLCILIASGLLNDKEKKIRINNSSADELSKYKSLLETGVITEAEFEAKKKQLLGL